ncbi:MAG: 2-isopropylmalate synthase [Magnetococcales bacterium]|nr:2-isopropylmalate synthase [Magnetococcales bacterium]
MFVPPRNKYHPAPPIPMEGRQWPNRVVTQAPRWCSIDLRDGNQALAIPMNPELKARMFKQLVAMGFSEIEAGFPAASKDDYEFVRSLAGLTPESVAIQVLTTAREEHIRRTVAAVTGIPRVILHFYISTSPIQRRLVFGVDQPTLIERAVAAARLILSLTREQPETQWTLQFSPESFSATESEFALAICEAVAETWQPSRENKVIFNLPQTVELAAPNRYADQIEWFSSHFSQRDAIIVSIHPHNDRGCGVAAAELALLAGADRVEGALFGNGERTGNLDLVTLALNLQSQGIETGLDFSDIARVVDCYQQCTGMEIPPRHPYAGSLVFTAFSGSHQDAIRKGLAHWKPGTPWEVPYLPIDPRDIGRDFSGIIRVNSQSGKGGTSYLLQRQLGIRLPKWLEPALAREVQRLSDQRGTEVSGTEIATLFAQTFMRTAGRIAIHGYRMTQEGDRCQMTVEIKIDGLTKVLSGYGNGPINAVFQALPGPWRLLHYEERAMETGSDARAIAFISLTNPDSDLHDWAGVGIHEDIVTASLQALGAAIDHYLTSLPDADWRTVTQSWLVDQPGPSLGHDLRR